MQRHHYIAFVSLASFLFLMGAIQFSGSPPTGRTAAPGEGTCNACHSGTVNSGPGSLSLSLGSGITQYTPNTTYTLSFDLNDPSASRYGFQVTALDASNNAIGTFALSNPGNTSLASSGGRDYVGHSNANSNNTWQFNWTAPASSSGPVTFYAAGNACDNNGSTSGDNVYTQSFTFTEAAPPSASFSSNSSSICLGQNVIFTDASTGTVNAYSWDFGSGAVPQTSSSAGPHSIQYSSPGQKTITLTVSNAVGTDVFTTTIDVNPLPAPLISTTGNAVFCEGDSVLLELNQPFSSYSWSNGSTASSINVNQSANITVTVTDANGCSATSPAFVTVEEPNPVVDITADGPATFCLGDSVTLSAGSGFASYLWSNGSTNSSIVVNSSGSFSVTVANAAGCESSAGPFTTTVGANLSPSITASSSSLCEGESATLSADAGFSSYLWSTGETASSITTDTAGTYSVEVSDANGCTGTSNDITVTVNPVPVAVASLIAGDSITTGDFTGYQWYFIDTTTQATTPISGAISQTIWYFDIAGASGNTGVVVVEVTDANGCTDISDPLILPVIGSITSGNFFQAWKMYPNPVKDQLHIDMEVEGREMVQCRMFDANGRMILHEKWAVRQNGQKQLSLSELPTGIYTIELRIGSEWMRKRIVKE